ncbi:MAG: hypothetical protein AB7K68_14585 [Bacteriovoracia bacterium]
MKMLLLLPVVAIALMSCGQLKPSAKNPYKKSVFGVSGACAPAQLQNAQAGSTDANILGALSVCPGADASSIIVRSNTTLNYNICAYPQASVPVQPQCFDAFSVNGQSLSFATSGFTTVNLVISSDRARYEQAMSYGGAISVPYAVARFR